MLFRFLVLVCSLAPQKWVLRTSTHKRIKITTIPRDYVTGDDIIPVCVFIDICCIITIMMPSSSSLRSWKKEKSTSRVESNLPLSRKNNTVPVSIDSSVLVMIVVLSAHSVVCNCYHYLLEFAVTSTTQPARVWYTDRSYPSRLRTYPQSVSDLFRDSTTVSIIRYANLFRNHHSLSSIRNRIHRIIESNQINSNQIKLNRKFFSFDKQQTQNNSFNSNRQSRRKQKQNW